MGKGTDKLYITHSEWSTTDGSQFGGSLGFQGSKLNVPFRKLPFNYCALSLQPYTHPVVTRDGTCFDLMNIVPWLKKHGTNPVTGEKMAYSELIKLTMHKNDDGEYCDPVTFKPFTDSTHIVAISTSGNVYSWDTIHRLNIKAKNWNDLLTDEEFTRKDLITIQDPKNLDSRDMSKFKYLQDGTSTLTEEQEAERANPLANINLAATGSSAKILAAKAAVDKARAARTDPNSNPALVKAKPSAPQNTTASYAAKKALPANAAIYTTGKAAASLTSTSVTPHTSAERATLSEEDYLLRPKKVNIKGYARIVTNLGNLNVELQTEWAPRAVYNFIKLAQRGYYRNTIFHRNIKDFMIQGGDPTGTGKGGQSCWGTNFKDELEGPLLHNARGIMSMANKGKNTNSSQFFITYKPTPHLDRKHTIFAKVVGGLDILDRMEKTPNANGTDRPLTEILIQDIVVFVDPFEEFKKKEKEEEEAKKNAEEVRKKGGTDDDKTTWTGKRLREDGKVGGGGGGGVGKYLKAVKAQVKEEDEVLEEAPLEEYYEEPVKKKVKLGKGGFGNFDNW